jgi:hypothetical protein
MKKKLDGMQGILNLNKKIYCKYIDSIIEKVDLKNKIKKYGSMSFWERLIFLLKGEI